MHNGNSNSKQDTGPESNEAEAWLEKLYMSDPSAEDFQQFDKWISSSPQNASHYRKMEQAWRDLALVDEIEGEIITTQPVPQKKETRWTTRAIEAISEVITGVIKSPIQASSAIGVTAIVCMIAFQFNRSSPQVETTQSQWDSYTTKIGEVQNILLADGSKLTLDASSSIRVSLKANERTVTLTEGRANFDIATDKSRPFIVSSGHNQLTVIGTQFDVTRADKTLKVSVYEGIVEVTQILQIETSGSKSSPIRLEVGEEIQADQTGTLGTISSFDSERGPNWRDGLLTYNTTPLIQVVSDINRYRHTPVRIGSKALESFLVTTAFNAHESDELLIGLESSGSVEMRKTTTEIVLYEPFK